MTAQTTAQAAAAERLAAAERSGVPAAPVRDMLGDDLDAAYATQELVITARENPRNPRVGRKVGLTAVAVQRQLGVDQPDFGVLLADMRVDERTPVPIGRLLQPRIEAEIAFVLRDEVLDASREAVVAAVDHAVAALEIVDSRVADWDITIVDTVADNASSARFVLGADRVPLAEIDTVAARMRMTRDGETVAEGDGAACLGDPVNALVWVAETALRLGRPLQAGEVVLSGALGPMIPFGPGDQVTAQITGLGSVSATATKE